jgi:thioredoxin-dependent peroxiredoxin
MELEIGSHAPDFSLADENETIHNLADYLGKPVVLYFYPKDDTPGCTLEACSFRDNYSKFLERGIAVLGISPDKSTSHLKFKTKYSLQFPLLADMDHNVCTKYGVWGLKKMMGREYEGVIRTTFLIDSTGKIQRILAGVKSAEHSEQLLAFFDSL